MKMFSLLDIGERAGSGIPMIYQAWREQGWDEPVYIVDRVGAAKNGSWVVTGTREQA